MEARADRLPAELAAELHQAIDAAEGHRSCRYIGADEQPRCVMAQLAAIRGVTVGEMEPWKCTQIHAVIADKLPGTEKLEPYFLFTTLLKNVQAVWDGNPLLLDEKKARELMHGMVNEAAA